MAKRMSLLTIVFVLFIEAQIWSRSVEVSKHLRASLSRPVPSESGPRAAQQVDEGSGDKNIGGDIRGEPELNHYCLNGHFCPSGGPNSSRVSIPERMSYSGKSRHRSVTKVSQSDCRHYKRVESEKTHS